MGWLRNKEKKKLTKLGILANERAAKLLEELIECCDGKSNPIKFFSANQILKATNIFSWSNHISELSCYGFHDAKWYSGKNENHPKILVKKLSRYEDRTFIRDVAVSSIVSGHKNFMKLVGCCFESIDPVMVYDGVKKHYKLDLSKETWKKRMKIAEDIATALAYLHTAFPRPLVYRIFSPGNILVDEDGAAKLTDFSHCVSIPEGETFVKVDNVAGTFGYMDEKYFRNLVVSEETDIFAIGNLMLRLLTGDVMFLKYSSESFSKRFKFIEERRMDEVTDQELLEKMGEVSEDELSQMKAIKMLLLRCVGRKGEIPTMVEVAKELKKIQRSLNTTVVSRYNDSSSSSGETQLNLAQDMSSTVVLSIQTTNT